MKPFKFALIILLCFGISTAIAQTIDAKKSKVEFHITGGGLFKVKGTFTGMKGDFNFDETNLENSNFNICIDASTINTKNKKRDAHLKDPDFFDVDKYPTVCFESTAVVRTANGFVTKGNMTILETTRAVEIPFTFENNTFFGELVIDRFDYELGKEYGTIRVGKEATITIKCIVRN
ncbi:YceI family protein [Hyunsoonleella sp. SJ7]|uniref:YceI family protein n=1 Tax=Hyunsoonleella aquatilis TaxID=2762758 RepID=A0A923HG46_9FLAO|nr:YceI family protein [Hyunsoonleella aquatilis]MBC3758760.1 YceI family protein [Hyunsoonleella aquatilis]